MSKTSAIEVYFAEPVEFPPGWEQRLNDLLDEVCHKYESENPGRVMWVFGWGCKMLTNPFMASEDRPIQFDDSVLQIEIAEREK